MINICHHVFLGVNTRTKPYSSQVFHYHRHLPVIKLPARENQIALNKNNLIVNKSLYRPHFKAHLGASIPNQSDVYKHNTNYHIGNKLTRNFKFLLSRIQNRHRYQMKKSKQVPVNNAQPLISPVVIDPVIQIDQEVSKLVFHIKMNNC